MKNDIASGKLCPECGSRDTEDNGEPKFTEYRCRDCDHRWGNDGGILYGYDFDEELT